MINKIKSMFQKIKFNSCGKNVKIYQPNIFVQPNSINLANNIIISEYCWIQGGKGLYVGSFVHIAPYVNIGGGGCCIIEDFSTVSVGSRIFAGTDLASGEGLTDSTIPLEYRAVERAFIHLQKYVFITTEVVIHPGVTIGEGAVVGSNSVVTQDIEPWTINVGQPAKPIRSRKKKDILKYASILYKKNNITPMTFSNNRLSELKTINYFIPKREGLDANKHIYRKPD